MDLVAALDGSEWTRVRAPALGTRAWILGVIAVQLGVEDGQVRAQARASVTGKEAQVRALGARTIVQMALVAPGAQPSWPAAQPPARDGAAAVLECVVDGALLERVTLAPAQLADAPPRRAFAHAYCRWLRDGGLEPGFDLTGFLSRPPGAMYERSLHRTLGVGQIVSYALALAD